MENYNDEDFETALARVNSRWDKYSPPRWMSPTLLTETYRAFNKQQIEQNAPYACMLTVNFAHPYRDAFLLPSMDKFVRQLNEEVFGRAVKKKGYHLKGICAVEVCRNGGVLHCCLHFHLLIKPMGRLTADTAESILMPKVKKVLKRIKDKNGRVASNESSIELSPYIGIGTLPSYLTKEADRQGAKAADFIGELQSDRIANLCIPSDRYEKCWTGCKCQEQ